MAAWLENFPFPCRGQGTGESRTASHAGKRKKDHGLELVSRVALCPRKQPFAEAILAPVGAESINAQRPRDGFETRTASGSNARLHTAEWGGEANAFPSLVHHFALAESRRAINQSPPEVG